MLVKRYYIFFFKQKTAYEMRISDWSSDVCSSDLERRAHAEVLDQWHSLVDIAEIAASAGVRVSVVQASSRQDHLVRNGIEYHFADVAGSRDAPERSRRFAALLSGIGADVLHVHGLAFAGDAFAVSRRLPRMPLLCQDHADRPPRRWRRRPWKGWYAAVSGVAFTAAAPAQRDRTSAVQGKKGS